MTDANPDAEYVQVGIGRGLTFSRQR